MINQIPIVLKIYNHQINNINYVDSLDINILKSGMTLVFVSNQSEFDNIEESIHVLNDNELKRFNGFFRQSDKRNFLLSRIILKSIISRLCQVELSDILISQEENVKPKILYPSTNLNFSLSHAKDYVLVGFSLQSQIGVDIEFVRPSNKIELIAANYFSAQEQENIKGDLHPEKVFFDYWTRKESAVKLIGLGLLEQIRSFEVCNEVNNNEIPIEIDFQHIFLNSFTINDYQGCIALSEQTEGIKFIQLTEEILKSWLP